LVTVEPELDDLIRGIYSNPEEDDEDLDRIVSAEEYCDNQQCCNPEPIQTSTTAGCGAPGYLELAQQQRYVRSLSYAFSLSLSLTNHYIYYFSNRYWSAVLPTLYINEYY